MIDQLIRFEEIPWERPANGVTQKIYATDGQRLRLIRFGDDFVEKKWCMAGHIGFVLSGEMSIDFDGAIQHYRQGDGLWIVAGETSRHKVRIDQGKQVELILFETMT
ncbi:MAG: cupin domain-containing protein [Bacteroidia bacterium]|nr:cupin domain-containing protein [Bacteroidia bacterium]